ncbi:DUF3617 family protein [Asticcacaulis sp. EMRT-3]|uniref:DUF3617 domain-containing protein n=1 Tax=Asticcacaulis sp. EMRT-3 TaxID=3040349 RepID=UPI0024AE9743|nr:DUF3617 family protein [Asticcacaulis sp. EMRT-3]MDI7774994.1 hypothetical protein [Asticcacaulis sp. EMRT-3]
MALRAYHALWLGLLMLAACQQKAEPVVPQAASDAASSSSASQASPQASEAVSSSSVSETSAIGPLGQKPGLWKLTQTLPQTESTWISSICISAEQGERLAMIGQDLLGKPEMSRLSCTRRGVVGGQGKADVDTVCEVNDTTLTSHIHADIIGHKVFHQTVETRYSPAFAGHGDQVTVTDAAWQGPCPAGMKPGDYIDHDGVHSKVADVLAKFR